VSDTGQTTATLTGTVNPQGTATSYTFSYGPSSAYGAQTQPQSAGSGNSDVAATTALSGLTPATVYHYRLVATSSAGTTYGADKRFATSGYYQNPVYAAAAMPDPFVLDNGGKHSDYWAFGTGNLFPVLHSSDLLHWIPAGTAMPARPAWVTGSRDWHPWSPSSVLASSQPCPGTTSRGCYVMYYVGLSAQLNVNCVGVATSPTPGGPYSDQGPLDLANSSSGAISVSDPTSARTPLGCGDAAGAGNIDPSPFIDSSGRAYLYVSTDRSCSGGSCTLEPTISVIPLTPDFLRASGSRTALFSGDVGTWEASEVNAPTVEGPSMELHDGTYYLFYSGGSWQGAYGMGYATATSPMGPFAKSPSNPILAQSSAVLSPGGGDALVTGPHGGLWMVYAGRDSTYAEPRTLRLDAFTWKPATSADAPDIPVISGPTATPQATQP
jgi:beta-xylosidase